MSFFRDELYFIVCGDRPDWGYVDQPAIVPLLASFSHAIFGDFLWGFRLLPTLAMSATVAAPLTLPILPVDVFIRYQKVIGFTPSVGERQNSGTLPQYYADMFGWREMAEIVAAVYSALPPQDRARAVFYGENYGEAAAIDVFGQRLGLPPAISGHNNYFLWGPRGHDGSVVIIIGGSVKHYEELFGSYEVAGRIDEPLAMPYETGQPIYVLRKAKVPLPELWPSVKNYN